MKKVKQVDYREKEREREGEREREKDWRRESILSKEKAKEFLTKSNIQNFLALKHP